MDYEAIVATQFDGTLYHRSSSPVTIANHVCLSLRHRRECDMILSPRHQEYDYDHHATLYGHTSDTTSADLILRLFDTSFDRDLTSWIIGSNRIHWLACLVEQDKSYWISACFVKLSITTLSMFTHAFIASSQLYLLNQYSHATTGSISTSSDAFEDQHTPIYALRDVSPDLILSLTLSIASIQAKILVLLHKDFLPFALPYMVLDIFQSLADSSAITACSCLVTSDEDFSHRIHLLDHLVEHDKDLTHDHHDKQDCSFIKQDQEFSLQTIALLNTTDLFEDILPIWIDTAPKMSPVDAFFTCPTHDDSPGLDLLLHADYSRFCYILLPVLLLLGPSVTTIIQMIIRNIRNFRLGSRCRSSPNYLSIFSLYLLYIQLSTFSVEGRCRRSVRLVCPLTDTNMYTI
jgi:hypothetical protein